MKKFLAILMAILMTGGLLSCGQKDDTETTHTEKPWPEQSSSVVSTPDSESSETTPSSEPTDGSSSVQQETPPEEEEVFYLGDQSHEGGCQEHDFNYHGISSQLIRLVGVDAFDEWAWDYREKTDAYGRVAEDFTVVDFVKKFEIDREAFKTAVALDSNSLYHYTDEQLDAIWSGDQKAINKAFCGELAWYNEGDGQLYSIYWLVDHGPEDYKKAGIPEAEIERMLLKARELGGINTLFAELVEENIAMANTDPDQILYLTGSDGNNYGITWLINNPDRWEEVGISDGAVDELAGRIYIDPQYAAYMSAADELTNILQNRNAPTTRPAIQPIIYDVPYEPGDRGEGIEYVYRQKFTSIDGRLIEYVGSDKFNEWTEKIGWEFTMKSFIEDFDLTADEVIEVMELTDAVSSDGFLTASDVRLICESSQAEINRHFVSDIAAISETGDIFTIFWLAEHTAADYAAFGLTSDDIERILPHIESHAPDLAAQIEGEALVMRAAGE